MTDLLDPEVFAEYNRLRQRATGIAVASFFGVAAVLFWAIAYLTQAELELPLAGSVSVGLFVAAGLWWRLSPKKLVIDVDAPRPLDDAELDALSAGFVAPSVTLRMTPALTEDARRLLLVAAIHFDRMI